MVHTAQSFGKVLLQLGLSKFSGVHTGGGWGFRTPFVANVTSYLVTLYTNTTKLVLHFILFRTIRQTLNAFNW